MASGPTAHSFWVVEGRFAAGAHPTVAGRLRLRDLVDAGFDTFIDLTTEPQYQAERAEVWHFPIPDMGLPTDAGYILDAIDRSIDEERRLYLHCWAGRGRTGTIVGCWLARHGAEDPLEELARLRGHLVGTAPETEAQREFVRNWRE